MIGWNESPLFAEDLGISPYIPTPAQYLDCAHGSTDQDGQIPSTSRLHAIVDGKENRPGQSGDCASIRLTERRVLTGDVSTPLRPPMQCLGFGKTHGLLESCVETSERFDKRNVTRRPSSSKRAQTHTHTTQQGGTAGERTRQATTVHLRTTPRARSIVFFHLLVEGVSESAAFLLKIHTIRNTVHCNPKTTSWAPWITISSHRNKNTIMLQWR